MDDFFDNVDIEVEDCCDLPIKKTVIHEFYINYDYRLLEEAGLNSLGKFIAVVKRNLNAILPRNTDNITYTILDYNTYFGGHDTNQSAAVHLYIQNKFNSIGDACLCLEAFDIFKYNPKNYETTVTYIQEQPDENDYMLYSFKWNKMKNVSDVGCNDIWCNMSDLSPMENGDSFAMIVRKLTDCEFGDTEINNYIIHRYGNMNEHKICAHVYNHNNIVNRNFHNKETVDLPDEIMEFGDKQRFYTRKNISRAEDPYFYELFNGDFLDSHKMDIKKLLQMCSSDVMNISFSVVKSDSYIGDVVYTWKGFDYDYTPIMKTFVKYSKQLIRQPKNNNSLSICPVGDKHLSCCFYLGTILSSDYSDLYLVSVNFIGLENVVMDTLYELFGVKRK